MMRIIDSHTGGEPTRIIVEGGPDLGGGTIAEKRQKFAAHFDHLRRALLLEPRGNEVIVGALLLAPEQAEASAGVIFFNNEGYLGMCGHGSIGLAATLCYLGLAEPGLQRIQTPVGEVKLEIIDSNRSRIRNVPSYRFKKDQPLRLSSGEQLVGDIAWGGNWFYLIKEHPYRLNFAAVDELSRFTRQVMAELAEQGIGGANGETIDHVELFANAEPGVADSRNFVMCPGGQYDRSPCGTGTSAKLACLAADGQLEPGQIWRQQSITGSLFTASYQWLDRSKGVIEPSIEGEAFVTLDARVIIEPNDPFAFGIEAR